VSSDVSPSIQAVHLSVAGRAALGRAPFSSKVLRNVRPVEDDELALAA
jgi:hypothetical protein